MALTLEALQAQVEALTAALATQQEQQKTGQRTPEIRKPLTNLLNPPPSATVAKPNFFYDGMNLPNVPGKPFPTLRYRLTENGVEERCCRTVAEVVALGDDWSPVPPSVDLPSPLESIQDALEALTPEERATVMEEQRKTRLAAIQRMISELPPEDLASLQAGAPVKRGPGRPKKALA